MRDAIAVNDAGKGVGPLRGWLALSIVALFVAAILLVSGSSGRLDYPFLDPAGLHAPEIVYYPMYSPADARPIFLTISGGNNGSVQLEMSSQLASGGELRVWESTRYGASPTDAVGPYTDDGKVTGSLAVWHAAHTATLTLLHAWIGQTLVVISGPIGTDELLRVADSLRRTRPSSLML